VLDRYDPGIGTVGGSHPDSARIEEMRVVDGLSLRGRSVTLVRNPTSIRRNLHIPEALEPRKVVDCLGMRLHRSTGDAQESPDARAPHQRFTACAEMKRPRPDAFVESKPTPAGKVELASRNGGSSFSRFCTDNDSSSPLARPENCGRTPSWRSNVSQESTRDCVADPGTSRLST